MDASRARSELTESRFSQIHWVSETGSTNTDLLDAARKGAPEQALTTDFQSAGRGRLGRPWTAGPGASVIVSFLVRPPADLPSPHLATSAVGLAAAEAVEAVTGRRVGIKWPNDLVAGTSDAPDDRKLSGILAEAVVGAEGIEAVVVGIGINANWPELPDDLAETATALNHLVGHEIDRTELLIELVRRAGSNLDLVETAGGRAHLRERIAQRSATLGRTVRIIQSDAEIVGEARRFTDDGEIVVATEDGEMVVSVGDIVHLRPVDPA